MRLTASETIAYSQSGMLASDGWCKFADKSADGFVRSDGVGVVVLKPLQAAIEDGDRVRAVILGSAATNDGRSSGLLTMPSVTGQRAAVLAACAEAGVTPGQLEYVEAHGTGTPVGDPVELEALAATVGADRTTDGACLVGSVKTNIGHAGGAAGIIGLIKTVLCLEHRAVPPSLHFHSPGVETLREGGPLHVPTEMIELGTGRRVLAGVSSTGISGTNVHVVLSTAQDVVAPAGGSIDRDAVLPLSARSPKALRATARSYLQLLQPAAGPPARWQDLCFSASARRSHHPWRMALTASHPQDAAQQLRSYLAGEQPVDPHLTAGAAPAQRGRIVFIYPGQGSQWAGMGLGLFGEEPVFRDALLECDRAIAKETNWSVLEVLRDSPERLEELDVVQPALWAIQVGLSALWRSWDIVPDAVVGHSMGEVAAAHAAGTLSLEDAAAVICRRSRIARRLCGLGAMASVDLPAADVEQILHGHEDQAAIAAYNSPHSTVISGSTSAIDSLLTELERVGGSGRKIRVDFASHCPQVDSLREDLLGTLASIAPRTGNIPIHSTVLDREIDGSQMNSNYWMRNIREPVHLASALAAQLQDEPTVFVEISAHPVLSTAIQDVIDYHGGSGAVLGSLYRDKAERPELLASLARLYTYGSDPNWTAHTAPDARFVTLPAYPWQHQPYHLSPPAPQPGTGLPPAPDDHSNSTHGRLRNLAATVLGTAPEDLNTACALTELGLDSLMATRIAQQARDRLGLALPVRNLLSGASIDDLAGHAADQLTRDA